MSRRYANRRDANEPPIVSALEAVGCHVERLHTPVDLLVGFRGQNWLLEVKLPQGPKGGKPASERGARARAQAAWIAGWRGQVAIVRTPEDALRLVGAIQ